MGLLNRPYIGTYVPNKRKVVQYTPDALVYLNGDVSMAGCRTCRSRIDIQQFITSVSVDAGTEPGASSASVSLSIPRHYGDSILRDGNTILRNGLEVHIYMRGYFPMTGLAQDESVAGVNLRDVPQYPYYPVFHGVVTGVSHEYSGGYYTANLTCSGMLHFWQYMMIASNGAAFGARPTASGVRPNLRGHIYTGMSPFSIIYSLYRDTAGSAAGVGFALQSRTNYRSSSSVTGDSLYQMTLRYWEARFMSGMYRLRMHGASGTLFSAAQQAYLARLNAAQLRLIGTVSDRSSRGARAVAEVGQALQILDAETDSGGRIRVARPADLQYLSSSGGGGRDFGVNVAQMQAFVNDISQFGQVNFFESTYESKLDIATQVSNICGYEFYQDMDGDLVFKPPLYNLDTSSSRVYRIEPEDIISISFSESEPEATYMICKGGPFQNLRGAVDEAEWGVRSTYIDYRLVAQFGWREGTFESNYYNNARSAYWAAVANLDRVNKGVNSCSITIPIRPEIRQGFPVYISSIDCFYYVESLSHSLSFGSSATTTLNLVARRRKFIPPGNPAAGIKSVDLASTSSPPRSLQYLDTSGMPRLLGFPNVVMALDPTRINPLFFVIGFLAEESSVLQEGRRSGRPPTVSGERRDQFITNFVMLLWNASLLSVGTSTDNDGATPGNPRIAQTTEEENRVLEGPWVIQADRLRGVEINFEQMKSALTDLIGIRNRSRNRLSRLETQLSRAQEELFDLRARRGDASSREDEVVNLIANLNRERELLNQLLAGDVPRFESFFRDLSEVQSVTRGRDPLRGGSGANAGLLEGVSSGEDLRNVAILNFLFREIRERNPTGSDRDMSVDATGAINNSAGLLELLADRKASGGVNTPGYYRYYSASHPLESQQGYERLSRASREAEETLRTSRRESAERARARSGSSSGGISLESEIEITQQRIAQLEAQPPSSGTTEQIAEARRFLAVLESQAVVAEQEAERETLRTFNDATNEVDPRVITPIPLSDEEAENAGIPPNRRNDFVSLVDREPVNGLNVRTFVSRTPTPTSTSQIFSLCFEERSAPRTTNSATYLITNVETAPRYLRNCIGNSATGSQSGIPTARSIANYLYNRLSDTTKSNLGITGGDLVSQACNGLTGIVGPGNEPLNEGDFSGGSPTNNASYQNQDITSSTLSTISGVTADSLVAVQRAILTNKANALATQIGYAYRASLNQAVAILGDTSLIRETRAERAGRTCAAYFRQIGRLSGGGLGGRNVPITVERGVRVQRSSIEQFSPVYPVSDARGYEHYGTYQYGRGLSIEPGGNYQRLMALDPFQYVDPRLADEYVSALQSSRVNYESEEVNQVLTEVANQLRQARGSSPTADSFLLSFLNDGIEERTTGDETAMIAVGLRNYVFSNRDSVTKLPVSNAAFLLADLQPFERLDVCDCRGAEADLSLAAYVAGVESTSFVSIGDEAGAPTSDSVAQEWVKQQMLLAADSWTLSQAMLRGLTESRGRGSLFDSVTSILGAVGQIGNTVTGVDNALSAAANPQIDRLNKAAANTAAAFNRLEGDEE